MVLRVLSLSARSTRSLSFASADRGGWLQAAVRAGWSQVRGLNTALSADLVAATEIFHWPDTGLSCL